MNNSVLERVVGEIVEEEAMVGSVTAPASDGHGHAREQEAKLCTTAFLRRPHRCSVFLSLSETQRRWRTSRQMRARQARVCEAHNVGAIDGRGDTALDTTFHLAGLQAARNEWKRTETNSLA